MACKWDTRINSANLGHLGPRNHVAWHSTVPISIERIRLTAELTSMNPPLPNNPTVFAWFYFGVGQAMFVFWFFFFFLLLCTFFSFEHALLNTNFSFHFLFTVSYINSQHTNIRPLLLVASSNYGGVHLTTQHFGTNDLESPYQKPEWPALSSTPTEKTLSMASTIQPGQRTTE